MNFYKAALFSLAMIFANITFGSDFIFLLRDFALPNQKSDYLILGWCNQTSSYVADPLNCQYGGTPASSQISQNDKEIVVDFSGLLDSSQDLPAFDRYVTFREVGQNPAQWDDYLRVQFDPAGVLIASLVSNPLAGLPVGSVNVGNFINDTNEVISMTDIFSFPGQGPSGPYEGRDITVPGVDFNEPLIRFQPFGSTLLPIGLAVQPTVFIDEPGSLALMLAALFPFLLLRKRCGVT